MSQAAPARAGEDWLARLRAGDRRTLARATPAGQNEPAHASGVLEAIFPHLGHALVVGVTGAPGAGKSTLVGALIGEMRKLGKSIGVVAVDPSSPYSGGAILGDRIRMHAHAGDEAVFVRSLASRGHQGGLSRTTARVVDVMDAAGKDVVIVETVGAGQSDIEVAELAGTRVVVCAPGLGDDIQAIKAGILEIADVLVVNKADQPSAERTAAELEGMVTLANRPGWAPPVLKTIAPSGQGAAALSDAIFAHAEAVAPPDRRENARLRARRLVASLAADAVRKALLATTGPEAEALYDRVLKGELDFDAAARDALALLRED